MFCTTAKAVAISERVSEIDGLKEKKESVCVSSRTGRMRSSASHDGLQHMTVTSRVKNFISGSPLRRRRALSQSTDSGLNTIGSCVFGVPLVDLVTSQGDDIPKIIRRVVEHVEKYGLDEEGVYRVNGSVKTIEKLKALFNSIGDADLTDVELASIAGILKLFLRELPTALIPSDIELQLIDLQLKYPGDITDDVIPLLRECLSQLPSVNLAVLKYIIKHLNKVASHSDTNKMTPVSLSIVFGPGVFHCGGGLEGMKLQGYANSVLCRLVMYSDALFQTSPDTAVSPTRERPAKPQPYCEHIRKREGTSPISPTISERSVGDAINQSNENLAILSFTPPSPTLQAPLSPTSIPLTTTTSPSSNEVLVRRHPVKKTKRRTTVRSWSVDSVQSSSPNSKPPTITANEEDNSAMSPFSSHASSSLSPPTSPSPSSSSPTLTPRSSKVMSTVIEGSVKQYLFGPPSPRQPLPMETNTDDTPSKKVRTDVYGLLLPSNKCNSPATKKKKSHPTSHDSHMTNDDITTITSDPGATGTNSVVQLRRGQGGKGRERREGGRRNRQSVVVGNETSEDGTEIQVLSLNPESKGEGSKVMVMESGRVSDLVRQFDDTDDPIESVSPSREAPRKKKKMMNKQFDMFEKSGIVIGMAKPQSASNDKPSQDSLHSPHQLTTSTHHTTTVLPSSTHPSSPTSYTHHHHDDDETRHIPDGTQERLSTRREQRNEDTAADKLQHLTKSRPKGPANRRLPTHHTSSNTATQPLTETAPQRREAERQEERGIEREKEVAVNEGRRHRKSPRKQRRKKSPTGPRSHHRQHSNDEIAPESTTTAVEGWTEEQEDIEPDQIDERPSKPEPTTDSVDMADTQVITVEQPMKILHDKLKKKKKKKESETGEEDTSYSKSAVRKTTHNPENDKESVERTYDDKISEKIPSHKETDSSSEQDNVGRRAKRQHPPSERQRDEEGHDGGATERRRERKTAESKIDVQCGDSRLKIPHSEKIHNPSVKEATSSTSVAATPGLQTTLEKLMASLARKRSSSERPDSLQDMTSLQLLEEKNSVQRILLHFEKIHGRPSTTADKELMRPLYDRYREVKKLLSLQSKTCSTTMTSSLHRRQVQERSNTELQHTENTDLTLPSITLLTSGLAQSLPLDFCPPSSSSTSQLSHLVTTTSGSAMETTHSTSLTSPPPSSSSISTVPSIDRVTIRKTKSSSASTVAASERRREGGESAMSQPAGDTSSIRSLSELYKLQELALSEKKRIRKILRVFESQFMATHNRAATKEDRKPQQKEYQAYKAIKEKLLQLANEINKATPLQKTM